MKKLTLFRPYVSWRARWYALKVLCGTQLAEGPLVKQFEKEFKRYARFNAFIKSVAFPHPDLKQGEIVAVNSGTTALELAYELAGIGPGDEVITPVLTCTATNLPLVRRGATIVFADINDSLNIDIEDIERKITERTKAIVFVHFGGSASGLRQLLVLARRHNIRVIEDAAQSVGADPSTWGLSDYTCVSLQAIKTLTAGDGGFLICRDPYDAFKARKLRWFGYDREEKQRLGDTDLELAGYKYHMNDISAAIGLGNLRSLSYSLRKRSRIRDAYRDAFKQSIIGGRLLTYPWLTILVHPKAKEIEKFLKTETIVDCGQYHYRNDKYRVLRHATQQPVKQGGAYGDLIDGLPNMDRLEDQYLLLPFHHGMKEKHARGVIQAIDYFIARESRYGR